MRPRVSKYSISKNTKQKIKLLNSTIIIPYRGSAIRNRILYRILDSLVFNFKTNIFIAEHDVKTTLNLKQKSRWKNIRHDFIQAKPNELFDRTGTLNYLIKNSNTDIVFNHDADIVIHPYAYQHAEKLLLRKQFDFIMPHNGMGWNVKHSFSYPGDINLMNTTKKVTLEFINSVIKKNNKIIDLRWRAARGGIIAIRRSDYIAAGMENQNIISWGFEDFERLHRFETLGYKVYGGFLSDNKIFKKYYMYHYDHNLDRGANSTANPHKKSNEAVYNKIKNMNKDQILKEIATWHWLRNIGVK